MKEFGDDQIYDIVWGDPFKSKEEEPYSWPDEKLHLKSSSKEGSSNNKSSNVGSMMAFVVVAIPMILLGPIGIGLLIVMFVIAMLSKLLWSSSE